MTPTLRRVALLLVLATGVASCRLLPLGDRMPESEAPRPVDRSQAVEATEAPVEPDETAAPPSDPVPNEPSPTIEIPPPID